MSEKTSTHRIVIFEPDEDRLNAALAGRELSPGLLQFVRGLLKTKKWARKINIPSGHKDLAAVLVFTTVLKEEGLEIFSELHVYFEGKTMIERWQVVGEAETISALPKEAFQAIDIRKVRALGRLVTVEFSVPLIGGESRAIVKTFDFAQPVGDPRVVPHPLLESETPLASF